MEDFEIENALKEKQVQEERLRRRILYTYVETLDDLKTKYANWGVKAYEDSVVLNGPITVEYFSYFKRDANSLGYFVKVAD